MLTKLLRKDLFPPAFSHWHIGMSRNKHLDGNHREKNAARKRGRCWWKYDLNWKEFKRKPGCQKIMTHIIAHLLTQHARRCATCTLWSETTRTISLKRGICWLDTGKRRTGRRDTLVRLVSTRAEQVTRCPPWRWNAVHLVYFSFIQFTEVNWGSKWLIKQSGKALALSSVSQYLKTVGSIHRHKDTDRPILFISL